MTRDDVAVLEREDVERPLELVPREEQRDGQPAALPRRGERHGAREVVERHAFDQAERSHVGGIASEPCQPIRDERVQPRAEDRSQVADERLEGRALAVRQVHSRW